LCNKTAVVGVGNLLMGDEGVGVRVIQALGQEPLPKGVALFDGGTAFHALTVELAVFEKWIIVDAVTGGGPPGEIYRLAWEQVLQGIKSRGSVQDLAVSLHDLGVVETLMLERFVDQVSPQPRFSEVSEIVILGIEPERIELSLELSPIVESKLPLLLQAVRDELERAPRPFLGRQCVHTLNEEEPS
jgi:hydrogenase maturation protease